MSLTFGELESITNDYFKLDNGKAVDIYFQTSFLLNYLLKQHKGLWERPDGGRRVRVPLEYDGQEANFYSRGETISSDDRESVNAAYFPWSHSYSNATVYRIDTLKNGSSAYGQVQLVAQRVGGAQKSLTKLLADSIYDEPGGNSKRLVGFRACCNTATTTAYGNIQEADLVSEDGTTPWKGRRNTTSEAIDLTVLRTLATDAKVRDGVGGRPDLMTMTQTLWDVIADLLQAQQRFVDSKTAVEAGFTGIRFEGKDLMPDDFCPDGYAFAINSKHIGFAVHRNGFFMREKWEKIPDSPGDKSMKIYADLQLIADNRKAHKAHSNLF